LSRWEYAQDQEQEENLGGSFNFGHWFLIIMKIWIESSNLYWEASKFSKDKDCSKHL
jgi:hypothetical protein